ncbi:hypothetical protein ACIQYL_22380 [Lysinibacillus xylanilyticus]|uniref:hypothetical protein n=1 Tax=Lysinibacillus xylanilyticus TaxID=582475 RepID=UPI0038035675
MTSAGGFGPTAGASLSLQKTSVADVSLSLQKTSVADVSLSLQKTSVADVSLSLRITSAERSKKNYIYNAMKFRKWK